MSPPHINLLGPRGYNVPIKQQLIYRVVIEGKTPAEAVAEQCQASERSVRRWVQQAAQGIPLQNLRPGPAPFSIFTFSPDDLQLLNHFVQSEPDAYLQEMLVTMQAAGCEVLHPYQIARGLAFLGFTRKVCSVICASALCC